MLALTSPYATHAPHPFLPTIPSPLSPRSANIYGRPAYMSTQECSNGAKETLPYSKRQVKKAPSPKADELKERRRELFLRKVQEGREERRFESRGEDIMRLDFVQRQKQWAAERAREAPSLPFHSPEEDEEEAYDLPISSNKAMQFSAPSTQHPLPSMLPPEEEVDELLQRENQELEALLSYMPGEGEDGMQAEEHLYSDDDDYDALFSEFMSQDVEGQQEQEQGRENVAPTLSFEVEGEAMDMS